ncbi:hypothetical protein DB41_GR00030 [Neochlamydia sp. TUME1]|nr:hypothetical protein DB41_GR00030 [Neochlamydia sp. TUME1]
MFYSHFYETMTLLIASLNDNFGPLFLLLLFQVAILKWLSTHIVCHSTSNCLQKSSIPQKMEIDQWITFSIISAF